MAKHKVYKTNPLRKYIIISLFIFLFIGIGYSVLNTSLSLSGSINVEKYDPTLYNVLRKETHSGADCATEYTGVHQDSFDESKSTEKIYYWYGNNTTKANLINSKNNVIFAGFCWKLLRTTDTGGVKLVYNGLPSSGQCNNSGSSQRLPTLTSFNESSESVADAGYMYNARYEKKKKELSTKTTVLSSKSFSVNYWVADSISWDANTQTWELVDPYKVTTVGDSVHKYSYFNADETYNNSSVCYITSLQSNSTYPFVIYLSGGNNLQYYNYTYTYGSSFTKNNDGTYTINNATTFSRVDYFENYNNVKNKYVCINATNNTCNEAIYISYTTNTEITYVKSSNTFLFANSITYDTNSGLYTLNNNITFWNSALSSNISSLSSHHYTCFTDQNQCEKVNYIFYYNGSYYYIELTNGKSIIDAKDEMLNNDNVNLYDSKIKETIDTWYQNNLNNYTSYIDDVIYCNDRKESKANTCGWNPNSGSVTEYISFEGSAGGLTCLRELDQFSLSNPKAHLTYPVGTITVEEMKLVGGITLKINSDYWVMTGRYFTESGMHVFGLFTYNGQASSSTEKRIGVRPTIALKKGIQYTSGDGSTSNPYIVDAPPIGS